MALLILLSLPLTVLRAQEARSAEERANQRPGASRDPLNDERFASEEGCFEPRVEDYRRRHGINGILDPEALLEATREYVSQTRTREGRLQPNGVTGSTWTSLGPTNFAGRMTSIAVHPTTPGTILAGAAGGGLWKTTDSGATWSVLTDSIPNLAVGAVAYAPSDPNKIFLGTGENSYKGDSSDINASTFTSGDTLSGIGLLYSSDGGANWTLPSNVIASRFFRISVHPTNPLEIVAATSAGLLRSITGQNGPWATAFAHDSSGATKAYGDFDDLLRDPSNPAVLYATSYDRGAVCDVNPCSNPQNWLSPRVLKSSNGGASWVEVMTGLPLSTSSFYVGRISIAIAPSSPLLPDGSRSTLYAALEDSRSDTSHVYKTTNGGTSWSETALATTAPYYMGGSGWYDNVLVVAPSDANTVIAGGRSYVRTTDGGVTWSSAFPNNNPFVHFDFHDLRYDTGGTLFVATDGGMYTSTDNGGSATDRNANLVTLQYYTLALDGAHLDRMIGGTQDNGTFRHDDSGGTSWDSITGGDGFDCAIDPDVPTQNFDTYSGGEGNIQRIRNAAAPFPTAIFRGPPWPNNEYGLAHVVLDPNRPATIYAASYRLWKSTASGDGWAPLPTTTTDGSTWDHSYVSMIAVAPSDSRILMVGKYDALFRSTDSGTTWSKVTNLLPSGRNINSIAIAAADAATMFVALSGNVSPSVYYTTNAGASWSARSGSGGTALPAWSAQVVRIDPTDALTIYCGTDVGIYRSTDGGLSWSTFGTGLPAVNVYDLQVARDGTKLRAATHGRGIWELIVTSPTNQEPVVSVSSTPAAVGGLVTVTAGASATLNGTFSDPDGDALTAKWTFPDDGSFVSAVSGTGVSHTFQRPGFYPVTLKVVDAKGGIGAANVDVLVPEPEDACAAPTVIPASGPFPYTIATTTELSSIEGSDPNGTSATGGCLPYPPNGSLWYSFRPPVTASYNISLCGSLEPTALIGFTGSACGPYTPAGICLVRNSPSSLDATNIDCGSGASSVTATLTGGTTYLFELATIGIHGGPTYLTIAPAASGIALAAIEAGPAFGRTAGGTSVSLTGYGFANGATVSFGGTPATNVAVPTPNVITLTTPAHVAGDVDIVVSSGGKSATLRKGFTYTTTLDLLPPANVVATATSATHMVVSWNVASGADSYQIYRSESLQSFTLVGTASGGGTVSFDDTGVVSGKAYLYEVRSLSGGNGSAFSNVDLATAMIFSDDPIVAGTTIVKATHLADLRTAVNAVRTLAVLSQTTFTDTAQAGLVIKAVHITELRTALDQARSKIGLSALSYTDATLSATTIKAVHIQEVRNGCK